MARPSWGFPSTHLVGSAPLALVAALKALVALELNGSAQDVSLTLAGQPPQAIAIPWQTASVNGESLERLLDAPALRRIESRVRYLWPPGTVRARGRRRAHDRRPDCRLPPDALRLYRRHGRHGGESGFQSGGFQARRLLPHGGQSARPGTSAARGGRALVPASAGRFAPSICPLSAPSSESRWTRSSEIQRIPMSLASVLIIVVLTLLTALYVAAEFAAVSVRRSRLRQLAEDGHWLALRLLPYIEDPAQARSLHRRQPDRHHADQPDPRRLRPARHRAAPRAAARRLDRHGASDGGIGRRPSSTLIALTIFNVILGELVPKSVALQFPTQTALYTVFPMQWSLWVYGGFIRFLNGGGWLLLKVMGVRQTGHRHIHSPEELELLIAESRDGGLLEPDEHRRLQRALRMRLRTAGHLMVPRGRIHAADIDTPFNELLPRLVASLYTRVPVYRWKRSTTLSG